KAMPAFVQYEPADRNRSGRDKVPRHHGPVRSTPRHCRIGDDHRLLECSGEHATVCGQLPTCIASVGDDESGLGIGEQNRSVERSSPKLPAILLGSAAGLLECALRAIERARSGGDGRGDHHRGQHQLKDAALGAEVRRDIMIAIMNMWIAALLLAASYNG